MTTVADLAADKAERGAATLAAAQRMKALWPTRIQPWSKCRGTEGECNSGKPLGRDGFCSVCHKRVVTLIVRGYDVHPLAALRVSYARYRAATPQSAPKPHRKPPMPPRTFTEGDTGNFPTPGEAMAAKALPVAPAPDPAPMFGPKWAAPLTQMNRAPMEEHPPVPIPPPATTWNADADTIDALRAELATLRAQLRDPDHLRAALARIDAKAARIAALKAELAQLENE